MKKSLTSFVLVNFAAILTRPLERFCNLVEKLQANVLLFYYLLFYLFASTLTFITGSGMQDHMMVYCIPP